MSWNELDWMSWIERAGLDELSMLDELDEPDKLQ